MVAQINATKTGKQGICMDSSDDDINDRVDFDLAELQGKN
jgi:hypothetical protein